MELWSTLGDDLGPEKIVMLRDPATGLDAILVIDNTAAGPAVGGIRMATDITLDEMTRLARAMTLKNAAAGLEHGGAKCGITADPHMAETERERLIGALAQALRSITDFIAGPDMGLTEANMAQLHAETGRVIGLPQAMGGIPLDTLGTTGFGIAIAAEVAEEMGFVSVARSRVVIQGYGSVGMAAARFLAERGASIIGVSDSQGAIVDTSGINVEQLETFKRRGNTVVDFPGMAAISNEELVRLECEILVPAARPDVITGANAADVRARVIVQGANIPATAEAETILHQRGVLSIPDFIANAGGVICGAVEYAGGSADHAFAMIEDKIRTNTRQVLQSAVAAGVQPRAAATTTAEARIREMMEHRQR